MYFATALPQPNKPLNLRIFFEILNSLKFEDLDCGVQPFPVALLK
jgi:hypothetical protein